MYLYPRLKNHHIVRLYRVVLALSAPSKPEISYEDVGGARMFFWKKTMVVVSRFDGPANGLNGKWIPPKHGEDRSPSYLDVHN